MLPPLLNKHPTLDVSQPANTGVLSSGAITFKHETRSLLTALKAQPIATQLRVGIIPASPTSTPSHTMYARYCADTRIGDLISVWEPFRDSGKRILIEDETGSVYLSARLLAVILNTAYYSNHNGILEESIAKTSSIPKTGPGRISGTPDAFQLQLPFTV